jgi:hypothetical protein
VRQATLIRMPQSVPLQPCGIAVENLVSRCWWSCGRSSFGRRGKRRISELGYVFSPHSSHTRASVVWRKSLTQKRSLSLALCFLIIEHLAQLRSLYHAGIARRSLPRKGRDNPAPMRTPVPNNTAPILISRFFTTSLLPISSDAEPYYSSHHIRCFMQSDTSIHCSFVPTIESFRNCTGMLCPTTSASSIPRHTNP